MTEKLLTGTLSLNTTNQPLDLGYSMFDLQASLPASIDLLLLSCDRHSSASEILLSEDINRTGRL